MKELDRIIDEHEAGLYTELETYARIARITTRDNIDEIIKDLPQPYTEGFARWIRDCPYESEPRSCVGAPLDTFTDELIGHYKMHYWKSKNPREGGQARAWVITQQMNNRVNELLGR